MDYCFTLRPLETPSSTVWAPILTFSAYNTLNIPSTARHISLIRLAPLQRPLMSFGMEPSLAISLPDLLALKGGSPAFDRCLTHYVVECLAPISSEGHAHYVMMSLRFESTTQPSRKSRRDRAQTARRGMSSTLPVHSLLDGIAESAAAIAFHKRPVAWI